jgi:hypothetical protein
MQWRLRQMINNFHRYWLCLISSDGAGACTYRPDDKIRCFLSNCSTFTEIELFPVGTSALTILERRYLAKDRYVWSFNNELVLICLKAEIMMIDGSVSMRSEELDGLILNDFVKIHIVIQFELNNASTFFQLWWSRAIASRRMIVIILFDPDVFEMFRTWNLSTSLRYNNNAWVHKVVVQVICVSRLFVNELPIFWICCYTR